MDTKTLKAMADRLQELADGAEPRIPYQGICHIIENEFGDNSLDLIKKKFRDWPEFSGELNYPVPAPEHTMVTAFEAFEAFLLKGLDFWSGEYGAARRRLCGFLAQEIRKEIGDETN